MQAASHQWLDPAALDHWQSNLRDFCSRHQGYFPMYPTLPQGLPRYSTIFPEDKKLTCQRHPGCQTSSKRRIRSQTQECSNMDGANKNTLNKNRIRVQQHQSTRWLGRIKTRSKEGRVAGGTMHVAHYGAPRGLKRSSKRRGDCKNDTFMGP